MGPVRFAEGTKSWKTKTLPPLIVSRPGWTLRWLSLVFPSIIYMQCARPWGKRELNDGTKHLDHDCMFSVLHFHTVRWNPGCVPMGNRSRRNLGSYLLVTAAVL